MATPSGEQGKTDEQAGQDLLQTLMAPDAGCVKKRSRKWKIWQSVHLFAWMDLRWIHADSGARFPQDTKAWVAKGHSIGLVRGQTNVIYMEGECEWAVQLGEDRKEFRAETPGIAANWVATLRWRVCPWNDLLKSRSILGQVQHGSLQECGETAWPLRMAQLPAPPSVALEAAAKFARHAVGALPIAGAAISVLQFALEMAGRMEFDVDSPGPTESRLADITERTMVALQRAVEHEAEGHFEEVSELMGVIEEGARQLENVEHQSQVQVMVHGIFKGKSGPSTLLELILQCEQRLQLLEGHNDDNSSTADSCVEAGEIVDIKDGEGATPLILAFIGNNDDRTASEIAEILLEQGATVDAADKNGCTALSGAAAWGHTAALELLLNHSALVDSVDKEGDTPLSNAAFYGRPSAAKLLLERGAAADVKNETGATPLFVACQGESDDRVAAEVANMLLDHGASVDTPTKGGETPLIMAARRGRTITADLLLGKGASVTAADERGCTALSGASAGGHTDIADLLLDRGAPVNSVDKEGDAALSNAAFFGHASTAELLLKRGATVNVKNEAGATPLFVTVQGGNDDKTAAEIAKILVDYGAVVDEPNNDGVTPLIMAARRGHKATAEFLLNKGASVASADKQGCTALSGASAGGHVVTANLLLARGAPVDSIDKEGDTPLSNAAFFGNASVAELLMEFGARADVKNETGGSPLFVACQGENDDKTAAEVARILLDHEAPVDSPNIDGVTPLMAAAKRGHTATSELLLSRGASPTAVDKDGQTAAQYANAAEHHELAAMLEGLADTNALCMDSKVES